MYQLKKFNVVKLTDNEAKKEEYLAQGYELIEEAQKTTDKKSGKKAVVEDGTDGAGSNA